MRFKTLVLGTLFMFGLLLTSGISYGYERAIEAEMADTLSKHRWKSPMTRMLPVDSSCGWRVRQLQVVVVKAG